MMYSLILIPFLLIFKLFPPGKRNYFYGYRSPYAVRSDEIFIYANRVAGNIFLLVVVLSFILQVLLNFVLKGKLTDTASQIFTLIALVISFILTEIVIRRK